MTWPSAQTKVNFDEGTDDPKSARSEFAGNVDKFNTLIGHFSALAQTFVADTTAGAMRTTIDAQQLINSLTAETSPAIADTLGFYDDSAGAHRKITFANWLKIINSLPEDSAPDNTADFAITYDASAGAAKKVKIENLKAGLTLGSVVSTGSGTANGFTGLPAGLDEITLIIGGSTTDGSSNLIVQIGDGGGYEISGYTSSASDGTGSTNGSNGFIITRTNAASSLWYGSITLTRLTGNSWIARGGVTAPASAGVDNSAGIKTLTGVLDRIRLTTVNGTDLFDGGQINILHQ